MKVIFMGTPDFAVPSLTALKESGCEIGYVLTQPDKVRNRGKKVSFTPVKEKALEYGIEVLQPVKVRGNAELMEQMKEYAPDLMVVAAYGQILPQEVLDIPKLGCINVHASLLPRFRGAAPIQHSIIEGDEETGVTIMKVEEALDAGNMLAKASTPTAGKTGGQLHDELAQLGADLLKDFVLELQERMQQDQTEGGNIMPEGESQDESLATYASMIFKEDGKADFSMDAEVLERRIRALDPWPGVYTYYDGKQMKLWEACVLPDDAAEPPGTVIRVSNEGIDVQTGNGILRVTRIQMPGKKRVAVKDYLLGNKITEGVVLG